MESHKPHAVWRPVNLTDILDLEHEPRRIGLREATSGLLFASPAFKEPGLVSLSVCLWGSNVKIGYGSVGRRLEL